MKKTLVPLALLLAQSLFSCINPGDPRYAELLADRHMHQLLEELSPPNHSDTPIDLPALKAELKLSVPDAETTSIGDVDPSNFSIDSNFEELAESLKRNPNYWQLRAETLQKDATEKEPKFSVMNEYASALIFTGEYKGAIQTLKKQERLYPKQYQTATNLGTAYELSGNLKQAKKWISEGQKRNPASHQGSEWIHSAILDAKIALKRNSRWLDTNYVSALELGWSDNKNRARTRDAILVQLSERLVFVRAPNPIVSSLFFELGTIYEYEDSIQHAEVFYRKSLEFGDLRKNEIAGQRRQRDFKTTYLRLIESARSEVLRKAIKIASEKPDEDCCHAVRLYGQGLLDIDMRSSHSVESLTYQNPNFWTALLQMPPDNQLIDSILVSLYLRSGELDKARRITTSLSPFTFGEGLTENFGTHSMQMLTSELDEFYELQAQRIQSGIQEHDQGNKEAAIRIYKTVTDVFPKSVWANWEIALSSPTFLEDSLSDKSRSLSQKIQSLDPLFMIGGNYSGSREITQMLLRMELRDLGSKNLSLEERYYKYADNALLLEQHGLAAYLYWKATPILKHPTLDKKELLGRFLYCMEKLGHQAVVSIFSDDLSDEIDKTQGFVDAAYQAFTRN
ncbi:hypothetical protein QEH56_22010 [Pelagicoccus enzymogenes]|uniref:tetratricopeptide repeat protein n=1 Tax=Pelagicoccus enzymogenes TaxID=2773457 RepID=UPI00280DA55C|nr:hypothetical protein [Pelagicoccus enzymogenes]MDQ8200858.1 hypothetical protein [Pelagicoccus enzymogenes]